MSAFEAAEHDAVVRVGGEVVSVAQGRRQAIPLNHLFLSQKNARKARNPESIPALAAIYEKDAVMLSICDSGWMGDAFSRFASHYGVLTRGRVGP